MVFIGVAFEVFIAAENPPYGNVMERWGSTMADALVAFGVLGEVLASSRGRVIQGELTRRSNDRLAEAEQKAAVATAETARIWKEMGARRIPRDIFLERLKGCPTANVEIMWAKNDAESSELSWQISTLLQQAGWPPTRVASIPPYASAIPDAVFVHGNPLGVAVVATVIPVDPEIQLYDRTDIAFGALYGALRLALNGANAAADDALPAGCLRVVIGAKRPAW